MPALTTPDVEHLTLPNGLHVVLRHAPRLKRCAAALRVAAGSHDVPTQWPGLAHFLEHLFFLGTERFPADDSLMAFVQRHGGLVNASTRERTTDFFFELPQSVFAQGVERLCEMLSHPRLALADQRREREVLHAEFIAWSQDTEARYQTTLLQPLSARHPLRAFHAGNRYSLPVPRQAFQQALQDFYRHFYHSGQMILSLTGPQSLDDLRALATGYGSIFVSGERSAQTPPPPLLETAPTAQPITDPRRLNLIFACENLPESGLEALRYFQTGLTDPQPGGLLFELRERDVIDSLKVESLYSFEDQLLLGIEFTLTENGVHQRGVVAELFFDWLGFFESNSGDPKLYEQYALLQDRRRAAGGALAMAQCFNNRSNPSPDTLKSLLAQLQPAYLLHPLAVNNLGTQHIAWRLPAPNPFLRADIGDGAQGAVFLRWRLTSAHSRLWQMLNDNLRSVITAAQQAGVDLAFSQYGRFWQLKLSGTSAPMPLVVRHALDVLTVPKPETLARLRQLRPEPALIPIRQLLKRLPDACLSAVDWVDNDNNDVSTMWASARWTTFSVGLSEETKVALNVELRRMPGGAVDQLLKAANVTHGMHRVNGVSDACETAVLLFCPAPSQRVEDEAAWRLLAHLGQAPFYQRLRVELQLGYAVFSGLRQIAGQAGWLFGVQSPSASTEEIVGHLQAFIRRLPALIQAADLTSQRQALAAQFDIATMDPLQASEWLWQAHMAGHGARYPEQLQTALLRLEKHELLTAICRLVGAADGWLYLSNRQIALQTPFL
ncbi:pyrroloquinoline quinone biosynthesis protein PqqF [Pseudomonas sp. CCI3.2]|uniref:pyrroloquinoline quinone biosynthesis protein PqqF n=1 Tax=unclassified Pseudomonas TaxID=196821 RepID=UPI002AC8CD73|nr:MULTISPECIES: pyrroloquinoline quinone biosynthesis protein PqqF [unclassified Pseudomonas]MEB0079380.1 pyrroloquinoline quinone biosynthesis protein PqqF [Pseudomonas sp. MH10out]MEB0104283.1 pyrroloquinoline quinone biosynthesis protein PqqF [Pseudomonas sp. CCI3.2]MEB0132421.1 pyrroloquinoline quinone biosynthesis protein PqqF [Pseudomonas sp. CCI2.4]MEB0159703.1 pyrroloquinoline quinone biosynthesis protein PqqF [Pseudomonas sp. AH2 (2023)]MEB0169089.1 pyrroloquinoline quinone biosynthe